MSGTTAPRCNRRGFDNQVGRIRAALCRRPRRDPPRHQAVKHLTHPRGPGEDYRPWPRVQNGLEDERLTRQGTTVGTVDYIAPEQARDSRAASIQSDIYSLGCTFYYLLTGARPFSGGDVMEKLLQHAKAPPPDVLDVRPEVGGGVSAIIQKMMAKKPEDRFASYDQLINALDSLGAASNSDGLDISLVPLEDEVAPPSVRPPVETGGAPRSGGGIPSEARPDSREVRRAPRDDDGIFSDVGAASRDAGAIASDDDASTMHSQEVPRAPRDDDGVFSDVGPASRDAGVVASDDDASTMHSQEVRRAPRDDDGVFSDVGAASRDAGVVASDDDASTMHARQVRRAPHDDGIFSDVGAASRDAGVIARDDDASPTHAASLTELGSEHSDEIPNLPARLRAPKRRGLRGAGMAQGAALEENDAPQIMMLCRRAKSRSLTPMWPIACLLAAIGVFLVMRFNAGAPRQTANHLPRTSTEPAGPKPAPTDTQELVAALKGLADPRRRSMSRSRRRFRRSR